LRRRCGFRWQARSRSRCKYRSRQVATRLADTRRGRSNWATRLH